MLRFLSFARRRRAFGSGEINPDEVLIDARNLPRFDTERFEGRIERPISRSAVFSVGAAALLVCFVFAIQLYDLTIAEGARYAALSQDNRLRELTVFANRGAIFDRTGTPLAWNDVPAPGDPFSPRAYADIEGVAHVVGYARGPQRDASGAYYTDTYRGASGAEQFFDSFLTGENGRKIVETDVHGAIQSESVFDAPADGKSVTLSIDAAMTNRLYRAIRDLAERVGFRGGAGVVMDVRTGEVITLTSYPEYSPLVFSQGTDTAAIKETQSDTRSPFLNRAVDGLYTPGSIVKPYIALAALHENLIDPKKSILSTGAISIPNPYNPDLPTVFRDWKAHGWVDMREAIAVSSNEYFFTVGGGYADQKGLGIENLSKHMARFGFGLEVPGDFFAGESGVVPDPDWKAAAFPDEPWRLGDTYNTSIGQFGWQVTAMQAVRAVASLANGGFLLTPTIVAGGNDFRSGTSTDLGIPAADLAIIQDGMRAGVLRGTAVALNVADFSVSAKTGTAELGSRKEFVNSWVTGYFPSTEPRYAFAVLMERGPRANLYGAVVAMREVVEWIRDHKEEYLSEGQ